MSLNANTTGILNTRSAGASTMTEDALEEAVSTTPFVTAFVTRFLNPNGAHGHTWPNPVEDDAALVDDFTTILSVLLTAQLRNLSPDANSGDPLRDQVAQFLSDQEWPLNAPLPQEWEAFPRPARLTEILMITGHLLKAVNDHGHGSGGSPTQMPPHRSP